MILYVIGSFFPALAARDRVNRPSIPTADDISMLAGNDRNMDEFQWSD
jgi:hypothetical protein